jgi:argininosuccinate lyase
MPQKKNPDIAELTRGKSARVIGNLVALFTLLKGLPMTYNRDLQEDKEPLFDTVDTVRSTLRLSAAMLQNTRVNREVCRAAAQDPTLLATDLADYLVLKGVPFRQAHHAVGSVVALAESLGKKLNHLAVSELQSVKKQFSSDALSVFDLKRALAQRKLPGSPGTNEVKKQLARWTKELGSEPRENLAKANLH